MNSRFTAIQCPQCGSTDCSDIAEGRYRCNNCNTSFIDDTEKVEVTVKHAYQNAPPPPPPTFNKKRFRWYLIGLPIALVLIAGSFFKSGSSVKAVLGEDTYDMTSLYNQLVISKGTPQLALPVYRQDRKNKECLLLKIFDPFTCKINKEVTLIPWMSKTDFGANGYESFKACYFNNTLFVITANKLFAIAPDSWDVKDLSGELTAKFPEFSAGIAQCENLYDEKGFRIKANDAITYYYFPAQNKVYTADAYNKERNKKQAGKTRILYWFKGDERQELYRSVRAEDENGPCSKYSSVAEISNAPFTPGRVYLEGHSCWQDQDRVVITFKMDINKSTGHVIQCLDNSGKVLWTTPAIQFRVSQWTYPFSGDATGFLCGSNLCLNIAQGYIITDINTGKVLSQHYFSEEIFRVSVL